VSLETCTRYNEPEDTLENKRPGNEAARNERVGLLMYPQVADKIRSRGRFM
jgi:hypothetical protein